MRSVSANMNIAWMLGVLGFSILIGYSMNMAFGAFCAIAVLVTTAGYPLRALSLLVLLSPFTGTVYLRDAFLNIPGLKPFQMLAVLVVVLAVAHIPKSEKMPRYATIFGVGVFVLFTISILRSLQHLHIFNEYYFTDDPLPSTRYVLSEYVKPIIYLMPFFIIIKYTKTQKDMEYVFNIICITLVAFSVNFLYLYVSYKYMGYLAVMLEYKYSMYYGMHYNNIATFFAIGFPIVLRKYFMNKNPLNAFILFIISAAIGITLSRTAYLAAAIAILIYYIISKKAKLFPIILIISIAFSFVMSKAIINRIEKGWESGDINEISSDRIEKIWMPLIDEYMRDPKKILLGNGRYAIASSAAASKGSILNVMVAHNMYLEIILDAGLIGFIFFMYFYYFVLKKAYLKSRTTDDEYLKGYYHAGMIAIICFMAAGMTGRTFFPSLDNIFIWIILGSIIAAISIDDKRKVPIPESPIDENTVYH